MNRFKILFLLLCTLSVHGQELFFKPATAFQNILSLETYYTFQDSKGFIWVCTDGGVNRYDGNTTTNFTTKDGLVENVVFKAYEDDHGRIWFSTLSGMLCYYENNSFHSIGANPELKRRGKGSPNHCFFIGKKDTLFFSSNGIDGIFKIPPQDNYKTVIPIYTKEMQQSFFLLTINELKQNEGILSKNASINYHIPRSTHFLTWGNKTYNITREKTNWGFNNTWNISLNRQGNTFYALYGGDLAVVKKNNGFVQHTYFDKQLIFALSDNEEDLWVLCRRGGGYLYKKGDLKQKPLHFLNNLSVTSIMVDREGTIWASTLEKGVFVCNSKSVITFVNKENDQINNLQVDTNRLIVPHFSRQLITFFKNDSILFDTAKCQFSSEYFLRSYYQGKNYFYFSKHMECYYVRVFNKRASKPTLLTDQALFKDFIHYKGDTVLAISQKWILKFFRGQLLANIKWKYTINTCTKLNNQTILVGCRDGSGIFQLKHDQLVPYLPQHKQLQIRINAMMEDHRNRLWIATENGVMCIDENQQLHELNKQYRQLSLKTNALTIDENDNIWCSNGSSLIRIQTTNDLNNLTIYTFNTNHGLPDTRIEKLAAFDNKIYCTTKEYLFYFKTNALQKNSQPPLTQFKSISISGRNYSFSDTITVSHEQNNISVETITSAYKSPEIKTFFYKLEGYDSEWHQLNKGNIQYTNLDHGTYRLFVYSLNNDGLKGEPVSFTLIITRPFWYTWWFILIELIVAGLLGYYFLSIWRKRIERKEQEKAKVNQKIAEFKMTALRSQMNPHFIFNAIGSIQHFILQNEAKQSYNYLAKFSMLIRNILNNSREEYISLEQEIITLKLYIELEQIRFEEPFRFVIDIDEALDVEMDIPTMLIQPYVENSIWHGLMPKKSGGILELSFKKKNEALHVTIRDNGVGRKKKDVSNKHISKGMSITEQRIETLEATSQKKFFTFIADVTDEQNNPAGTEVYIIIPID